MGHPERVTESEESPIPRRWLPRSSFGRWWLRYRLFDAVYVAMAVCGVLLFGVTAVDSAVSWSSDRVLIAPATLDNLGLLLLVPGWIVLMLTGGVLGWACRTNRRPPVWSWNLRRRAIAVALGAGLLAFIIGGFIVGADKGSVRVLSGPRYQVSVVSLNEGQWTTVSAGEYRRWQARLVRGGAVLTAFGMVEFVGAVTILRVRHVASTANSAP